MAKKNKKIFDMGKNLYKQLQPEIDFGSMIHNIDAETAKVYGEFTAWLEQEHVKMFASLEVDLAVPSTEHPIDTFNRLTKEGWKLNLITGEYHKPELSKEAEPI